MLSFRQKIFLSYLVIFLLFVVFLYPIVTTLVDKIHERYLKRQVTSLVQEVTQANTLDELLKNLKEKQNFLFFRVTLIDPHKGYIYDSHLKIDDPQHENGDRHALPELDQALKTEGGYSVRYSSLFAQQMAYVAIAFDFHHEEYVLRASFPNEQILLLTHDLTFTFLFFTIVLLLLFGLLAWFTIHYLTKPIADILSTIRPFQEGKQEHLPQIKLYNPVSEFGQLAATLNALSMRVESQIGKLTHEKKEKEAVLESLIEGVVAVDRNMQIIYMNRVAEIFFEVEPQDSVNQPFSKLDQPQCQALLETAQKEKRQVSSTLKPKRGKKRFFDIIAAPSGHEGGAILVLQDKTGLHKVIERGQDFVANASHELKTPITIIRGFAETLHDHPELSREVCREITQKIVKNCTRMETLVKNLLTLAAVDEGIPDSRLKESDVIDLVEHAKQTLLTIHPQAKIEIETVGNEPYRIKLDSDLFLQAIINLLDNGIKYSKPPAHITVRVIKGDHELVLQVSDQGIGIPKEDLDRIFERFYAVDKSHSRNMGGSGLGLSIVQRIVDKHGGRIEVDSEIKKGTTFIITLPF